MAALYGSWVASIDGQTAQVRLVRHPDYAGGLRGTVQRPGAAAAQLAGDIDDEGRLALDESQDGHRISALWLGRMVAGSCGHAFEGQWRRAGEERTHAFTLSRSGGWQ